MGTFLATQVLVADGQTLVDVVSLSAPAGSSAAATCAGTEDGKLHCWGELTWLANGGTKLIRPFATVVTADGTAPFTGAIQTAIEASFACSVVKGADANEVWCWGSNQYGQLGNGDTTTQQYPVKVRGLTNPTKVITFGLDASVGGLAGTACAIDDSRIRCWGSNGSGQLGTGSTKSSELKPGLVVAQDGTALAGIRDIAGGVSSYSYAAIACARTDAGAVLCWGHGFKSYATPYGANDVVSLGSLVYGSVRVLTADGAHRVNTSASPVSCGKLN